MNVRIPPAVLFHLMSTEAWRNPGSDPEAGELMYHIQSTGHLDKDGAITLDLDAREAFLLSDYAEGMAMVVRANVVNNPAELGALTAAQALIRHLAPIIAGTDLLS